ncbi:hypothetical protein VNO77_03779 [Canavalia gladiata]|uniref:Uncharacterized protein n=1 Tax=Canavalia gladiata TaxID=3824 RepID=A0AAN9N101_CANGL
MQLHASHEGCFKFNVECPKRSRNHAREERNLDVKSFILCQELMTLKEIEGPANELGEKERQLFLFLWILQTLLPPLAFCEGAGSFVASFLSQSQEMWDTLIATKFSFQKETSRLEHEGFLGYVARVKLTSGEPLFMEGSVPHQFMTIGLQGAYYNGPVADLTRGA